VKTSGPPRQRRLTKAHQPAPLRLAGALLGALAIGVAAAAGIKPSSRIRSVEPDSRSPARSVARRRSASTDRVALLELATPVLARTLDPFPIPVRTLDAHLSSIEFLRLRQQQVQLASYDERLIAGAHAPHIPLYGVKG
jgi:hypothetical protein